MKHTLYIFSFFILLFTTSTVLAQVPQLFNYQGIARDAAGNPLKNRLLSLKISVLSTADAAVADYEETQKVQTNDFGLYTLQIGAGTSLQGKMQNVIWESGNKYIKVAIDPKGGEDFADAGTSQLLSVPYAIYADKAGTASNAALPDKSRTGTVSSDALHAAGDVNYLTKFSAFNTISKSSIFDNGTNIGIGINAPSPTTKLHLFTSTGNIEHIRMQNTNGTGFGKFMMYNDINTNYATFTKYGSLYPGGYSGIAVQYPFANMLAFGNNLGPFILSNNGNVGIAIVTAGTTKLYFNAQQSTGYLGIGGSAVPAANVHVNSASNGDTLKITNAITGHAAADGLQIVNNGNDAFIINKENSTLNLGTNNATNVTIASNTNVGIGTVAPSEKLEIMGNMKADTAKVSAYKMLPGAGAGKVLTSDANGNGTWQAGGGGAAHYIGESYGGGIVFYVYDGGKHGLIAATTDQNQGAVIRWWGGTHTNTRARADGVGAGLKNTAIIIANQGPVDGNAFAATVCNEYSVNVGGVTYGDWYLPSKHELNLLYLQKNVVGGFANVYYWSSTELLVNYAWDQDFATGSQYYGTKNVSYNVRAIRAF